MQELLPAGLGRDVLDQLPGSLAEEAPPPPAPAPARLVARARAPPRSGRRAAGGDRRRRLRRADRRGARGGAAPRERPRARALRARRAGAAAPPPTSSSGAPKVARYTSSPTGAGPHERTAAPARMNGRRSSSRTTRSRGCARPSRERGLPPFRADQLAGWVYRRGVEDAERMTNLPAELRARLAARCELRALELESLSRSQDGTHKGVLRAARRRAPRVGADPGGGPHDALRLDPGRLPARVLLLRHRQRSASPATSRRRRSSTRSAACARRCPPGGALTQRGLHGDGRAAAEPAGGARGDAPADRPEGASASRRDGSPSRPRAWCRRSPSCCAPRR